MLKAIAVHRLQELSREQRRQGGLAKEGREGRRVVEPTEPALEACDRNHQTPLHLAARRGHVTAIRTLLAANVKTGETDDRGATPALLAALNGHDAALKLLVEHQVWQVRNMSVAARQCAAAHELRQTLLRMTTTMRQNPYRLLPKRLASVIGVLEQCHV